MEDKIKALEEANAALNQRVEKLEALVANQPGQKVGEHVGFYRPPPAKKKAE